MNAVRRTASSSARDIGDLPPVVDPERKARCARSFRAFCDEYMSASFPLPWSADHLKVIALVEAAVLAGELFAMAMPRGSGKSTICERAALWALLYAHRRFVAVIGPEASLAAEALESIKSEVENNELLEADFPEVVFPVRALGGINQRASGQTYRGKNTDIVWTGDKVVMPTIEGHATSGGIIRVAGITGRIRGMRFTRPDGDVQRPDLVLIDDPQTDESAKSVEQCKTREDVLAGAVLGLAGPGKKISGLMTLTVIRPDDMADRILDRKRHPEWNGERTKMVYAWPTNQGLWDKYGVIWRAGMEAGRGYADATEFYRANREAMDAGSAVGWKERHFPDELSAIQHAMNLRLSRGDAAFFAEYQNEPLPDVAESLGMMTAREIFEKVNGYSRGVVPSTVSQLTAFVDVQGELLFWLVAGWEDDFTGYVVDYGTEPDQRSRRFTLRDARYTLSAKAEGAGLEGAIFAGLSRLGTAVVGRSWPVDGGGEIRISRCLVDANWGASTDTVYQFCRESDYSAVLTPSHGKYVGASSLPFADWAKKRGDRVGLNWRMPMLSGRRPVRHCVYDTNFWKTFIHNRLSTHAGDAGCLSLFGKTDGGRMAANHELLAEHITSETRVRTHGRGREVDEWKLRAEGRDNHWFDCLVGSAVAASMQGVSIHGSGGSAAPVQKSVSFAEMQRAARQRK